jgi:hypothetical protein
LISFAFTEPLLMMVMSWAGLLNDDPTFVTLGSVKVGVLLPLVAVGDDNTTLSVPAAIVWLLAVDVVKTA